MDNIFFSVTENEETNVKNDFDINKILNDLNCLEKQKNIDEDVMVSKIVDYTENYTIKELMAICDYYGISKELKQNKSNKNSIVHYLVFFEANRINSELVFKRQNLWFYINELKKDKFMKKYIIW